MYQHPNCRCVWRGIREDAKLREEARKFEAKVLLLDTKGPIIIPTREELIGVYLLERDDQLERK